MRFFGSPSSLEGSIGIPGNKSATLRAIVIAGLAEGVSKVSNPLRGFGRFSVIKMMRALGAKVDTNQSREWVFEGVAVYETLKSNELSVGVNSRHAGGGNEV